MLDEHFASIPDLGYGLLVIALIYAIAALAYFLGSRDFSE